LGWIVVLAIIIAAIYYIFFVEPPSAIILPTGILQSVGSLPTSVNPQDVVGNAEFQALRQYVSEPTSAGPVPVGRQNPFISP
jgi:hypothetical protein